MERFIVGLQFMCSGEESHDMRNISAMIEREFPNLPSLPSLPSEPRDQGVSVDREPAQDNASKLFYNGMGSAGTNREK